MVEMRWLERHEKIATAETLEGNEYDIKSLVKVLQYRYSQYPLGWSEWIDVPTVTEG